MNVLFWGWGGGGGGVENNCTHFDEHMNSFEIFRPTVIGKLAQMVERLLSMREVPGSIPGFSTLNS